MSTEQSSSVRELDTQTIITKFARSSATGKSDTGSPEVQIALVTKRIEILSEHTKNNAKDFHSLRGLMKLVSRRKGLLAYLKNESPDRYKDIIAALGLRK